MKLDKVGALLTATKALIKTLRVEVEFLAPPAFPSIVAFWHGRMLLLPFALRDYADKVSILISRHRDGELVAELVERLGFKTVRGSTGRGKGGSKAFLEMVNLIKRGEVVAITPDGPRGPREKVKPGAIKLSMVTGAPIYPLTFGCTEEFHLNSWDRFTIPRPFSKCRVILGEPLRPEEFKSEKEMAERLELTLKELTQKATGG